MSKAVDILLALRDFVYGAVWKSLQIDSFCGAIPVLRHLRAGQKFDCGSYPLRVFFAGFVPSCGSRRGLASDSCPMKTIRLSAHASSYIVSRGFTEAEVEETIRESR